MNLATIGAVLVNCVRSSRPSWLMGGRDPEDIAADPQATKEEIDELSRNNGWAGDVAAVMHPNVSKDTFFRLAPTYPLEAIRNPSFPMFLLEDPEAWNWIERVHADIWITQALKKNPHLRTEFEIICLRRARQMFAPWQEVFSLEYGWVERAIKLLGMDPDSPKVMQAGQKLYTEVLEKSRFPSPSVAPKIPNDAAWSLANVVRFSMMILAGLRTMSDESRVPTQAAAAVASLQLWEYQKSEYFDVTVKKSEAYFDAAEQMESVWQWNKLLGLLNYEKDYQRIKKQVQAAYVENFRESYYGPEAKREAEVQKKIKAATAQMQANTKQIVNIMNRVEESGLAWPDYLAIGVAVGGIALVVLAPELFIVSGVAEASGMFAVRSAATITAEQIALLAARAEVSAVTIEFGKAVALTSTQSVFLKELAVKLGQQTNIAVTLKETVEAVVKVTR